MSNFDFLNLDQFGNPIRPRMDIIDETELPSVDPTASQEKTTRFRGEFVPVNTKGMPVVYEKNDEVSHFGQKYKARKRNTFNDGTPENDAVWEKLTNNFVHSSGKNPHPNPSEGDEWYDTENGVLFKYLNDGDSKQWVEIS